LVVAGSVALSLLLGIPLIVISVTVVSPVPTTWR
jgi:hypothetical protein